MERLDKILANMGFGTRKEVKKLIRSGAVKVDDMAVTASDGKIDTDINVVTVFDKPVLYKKHIYLMLNKPQGYISATDDVSLPTVTGLLPERYAHYKVFPAGRLDIDTEGLLILTNDGQFSHNILSPKKHVPKVYFAKTELPVTEDDVKMFSEGMELGDFTSMPAKLEPFEDGSLVTIYEGKFHQVKRMFEKTGNKVTYLKRVKIGGIDLDESLEPGEVRELTEEELLTIWK